MSMADLLAKQESKNLSLTRGQEVEGEVIAILPQEIILDLGSKAEGVLPKKDLSPEQIANLKSGDKLLTFVIQIENESGQVVLALQRALAKSDKSSLSKWQKFQEAQKNNTVLTGKALELNKGGLIVEIQGVRGFLPSSQVALSQASNLEELIGQTVTVTVIDLDPSQNKLIFSQKTNLTEDVKQKIEKIKTGEKVKGTVAAILPFGVIVSLEKGVEGLVHVSEIAWAKVEDPGQIFKSGDEVEAKVISTDQNTGRVNLSIKQLTDDPFVKLSQNFQADDVVKGVVTKVTPMGVFLDLQTDNTVVEGIIPASKMEAETNYEVGQSITCLVDNVDVGKRRVNLAPFVTSTKDLIYK